MKILLDYVFPISVITPTPAASSGFLKQACVVAKPKAGQEGNVGTIYECSSMTAVAARTDNTNAQQLFNSGMSKVYILLANDLDLEDALADGAGSDFYTLLISDDFDDEDIAQVVDTPAVAASKVIGDLTFTAVHAGVTGNDISVELLDDTTEGSEVAHAVDGAIVVHMQAGASTAAEIAAAVQESVSCSALVNVAVAGGEESTPQADAGEQNLADGAAAIFDSGTGVQVGTWDGVIGVQSQDADVCEAQAVVEGRVCFFSDETNGAKNMMFAFGTMLSNPSNWLNQQFITMPFDDGVDQLGDANSLFDDKVSFVLKDDEFGNRLALFACGAKAIVSPYILKNLRLDLQSNALTWISGNQPSYTKKEAALLETRLQEDVINAKYVALGWIEAGTVEITLVEDNFVANGAINVAEPKALWRVFSEMRQTL